MQAKTVLHQQPHRSLLPFKIRKHRCCCNNNKKRWTNSTTVMLEPRQLNASKELLLDPWQLRRPGRWTAGATGGRWMTRSKVFWQLWPLQTLQIREKNNETNQQVSSRNFKLQINRKKKKTWKNQQGSLYYWIFWLKSKETVSISLLQILWGTIIINISSHLDKNICRRLGLASFPSGVVTSSRYESQQKKHQKQRKKTNTESNAKQNRQTKQVKHQDKLQLTTQINKENKKHDKQAQTIPYNNKNDNRKKRKNKGNQKNRTTTKSSPPATTTQQQ